jgi:hypothetical protein
VACNEVLYSLGYKILEANQVFFNRYLPEKLYRVTGVRDVKRMKQPLKIKDAERGYVAHFPLFQSLLFRNRIKFAAS